MDASLLLLSRPFAAVEVSGVSEQQAWTVTDARIKTAVVSRSLNQLKNSLFKPYSSAEASGVLA
jgi:hypothetical protein